MSDGSDTSDSSDLSDELRDGIALWEAGHFVEAHEEFERLWLVEVGPRRHFLRGLVHAAMGFHYLRAGDTMSAGSKLGSAAELLDGFDGDFLGLDVDGLRAGIAGVRAALRAADDVSGSGVKHHAIPRLVPGIGGATVREGQP